MSVKTMIRSRIVEHALSDRRLQRNRAKFEKKVKRDGAPRVVDYFHDVADPYAHLTLQMLTRLQERYDIKLVYHLISRPPKNATPEREALDAYSRKDARVLADHIGLELPNPLASPTPERLKQAQALIAAALSSPEFVQMALTISTALWTDADLPTLPETDPSAAMAQGDATLAKRGHYLGATFAYGGECYWGVDRLHFLESRLRDAGAARATAPNTDLFAPPAIGQHATPKDGLVLEMYASFRSPYAYIAYDQARALAKAYGARFDFYTILPMVTRGLAVPQQKKIYIMRDAAREAQRLGIPYGRIVDPLGLGVERGQSLINYARKMGKYEEYCSSFFKGVWADGLDAATDRGLSKIVSRVGLDWEEAKKTMSDDSWRDEVEQNRKALISLGLWGAPTFRVGETVTWGQDRIWVAEKALRAAAAP